LPFVFELGDLWPRSIVAVGALRAGRIVDLLERIELFLYRRATTVVALTYAFKHDLVARGIPVGKIVVIRNGVDLARYRPRARDLERAKSLGVPGKFVVGYIGTHGLAHDLGNVLAAAERLSAERAVAFLLVGAGADRERLITEAQRRALANVVFVPMQPKDAMASIWSICDIALVHLKNAPAFSEVIPSKIFEAMAMGLPILLVSPDGEASQILAEDGAGLWAPAGDPTALAEAIRRLFEDTTLRDTLAQRSLAAAQNHTRERQAALFIAVLEKVVAGVRGACP
jgi:colanic acid biosynthesis glycosyl transferase WcaI